MTHTSGQIIEETLFNYSFRDTRKEVTKEVTAHAAELAAIMEAFALIKSEETFIDRV